MADPTWNGKVIASPKDHDDLEARAARHQFHGGLERSAADARAYAEYKSEQHAQAAAHHLKLSQNAVSAGDRESGEKHRSLFDMHVQALGHRKSAQPPAEVRQHMTYNQAHERYTGFKQHGADRLLGS